MAAVGRSDRVPGPPPARLLGGRGYARAFRRDPLAVLAAAYERYGPVSALVQNDPTVVFALGPETNRRLLVGADRLRGPYDALAGEVAGASDDDQTGRNANTGMALRVEQRRLRAAACIAVEAERYHQAVVGLTTAMVERWGLGCELDVDYVMRELTLQIVLQTVFGLDPSDTNHELARALRRWSRQNIATPRPTSAALRSWTTKPIRRTAPSALALVLQRYMGSRFPSAARGAPASETMLHTLRALAGRDDAAELAWHGVAMLAAANAASAAITWTFFLLSQHQRILDDLQVEITTVLGDGPPTTAQLARLPRLDRIVKESLRLLPPCSVGWSITVAPLELDGCTLPAGTTVISSPYLTHRLAEPYFGAQRFRPDRWLYLDPEPHVYLPFGIDETLRAYAPLATLQTKIVVAMVVQRYFLGLAMGRRVDPAPGLLLMPKGGLGMIISPPDRPLVCRRPPGGISHLVSL